MSEEPNKAPSEGEARVLSDDELKGIVGGKCAAAVFTDIKFVEGTSAGLTLSE